ncbi:hypothetical protein CROQUDRAFT_186637 [Cronartium quercuum f. sp. fusiforme G11]|uniref:Uncharacterized protein n=1 Tax=Cronartium quercuum f. sp. fusiforme G11 TaxID=708437 RepID=A0A9P6NGU2_9BASI|nr:hypothetical protein CROQUDRAFT_186637 [Cronartium quercuum f. sp. fusiforme G11]
MQIRHQLVCSSTALVWLFSSGLLHLGFLSNSRAFQFLPEKKTTDWINNGLHQYQRIRKEIANPTAPPKLGSPAWPKTGIAYPNKGCEYS